MLTSTRVWSRPPAVLTVHTDILSVRPCQLGILSHDAELGTLPQHGPRARYTPQRPSSVGQPAVAQPDAGLGLGLKAGRLDPSLRRKPDLYPESPSRLGFAEDHSGMMHLRNALYD